MLAKRCILFGKAVKPVKDQHQHAFYHANLGFVAAVLHPFLGVSTIFRGKRLTLNCDHSV